MHHFGIFRLRRRFASRMRSGFDEQAHRAASQKLRIYDARCAKYKICIVCIISGYFACGEDSLRECEVDSMSKLIEPHLLSSVNMMHAVASYLRSF